MEKLHWVVTSEILFVDDGGSVPSSFIQELRRSCRLDVTSLAELRERLGSKRYDVILFAPQVPNALEACHDVRELSHCPEVVLLTTRLNITGATEAIRAGASDLVSIAEGPQTLLRTVDALVETRRVTDELARLEAGVPISDTAPELIGNSEALQRLRGQLLRVAASEATVLITGETGTGKEIVARALHGASTRRKGPFVAIGCSTISPNLMESEFFGHAKGAFTNADRDHSGLLVMAHGGTLFLDEMSDLPLDLQAKLLRALQERRVRPLGSRSEFAFDARVLVATRKDLAREVEKGHFREDLYFRLKVIELQVPPLRNRRADVLVLAQHFILRASRPERPVTGMTLAAAQAILQHDWPGNVRELEHCIMAAVAVARYSRISALDLPGYLTGGGVKAEEATQLQPLKQVQEQHIRSVLASVGGNKARASKLLGLDRKTLYRRLGSSPHASDDAPHRPRFDSTPG